MMMAILSVVTMRFRPLFLRMAAGSAAAFLAASAPAQVVITEFMADNASVRADEDGDFSDWIELHNPGTESVNLDGWALTDLATQPARWTFPAVSIGPKAYLVVWASNKNRRTPGKQLHTNFRLDATGEYLALVRPNGAAATEFAPAYPPQVPDLAYGFAAKVTTAKAITQGAAGRVLVPRDGSLGSTWRSRDFDDSSWSPAVNGIGFETGASEFGSGWTSDVLGDGPGAFYRLEETGTPGTAALSTGTAGVAGLYLNGAILNSPSLAAPTHQGFEADNTGTKFDGTNDKIDIPWSAAHNAQSFSFSFWMRWNGANTTVHKAPLTSRESTIVRGYVAYVLPTTQQLSFWTGTGSAWDALDAPAATGTIAANQWYHVAGTFDAANLQKTLYLNGTKVAEKAVTAYAANTQFPLRIGGGATEGAGQFWFPGDIDEVAVFDRSLSGDEVAAQFTAATTGAAGTEAAAALAAQSPQGWWRLKDSTTPVNITVANAGSAGPEANGSMIGSITGGGSGPRPPSEAGMPADNKAPRFAGGYIETPYHPSLNPSVFTVECWARATGGTGTFRAAVSGRNDQNGQTYGYIFYAASNNTWQFWTGSGASGAWDPITGPAVTLNQWVHLAGTYDGTVKRFYVNGTQVGTGTSPVFNPNTVRGLRIGAGQNETAATFFFQGDIDEVAVHPRALSASEVAGRYQLGKNNTQPPPLNDFAGLIGTGLAADMYNVNASAFFRLPFQVENPAALDALTLRMKYDDGFVAWLNGVPVALGNAPGNEPAWNATATERSSNSEAVQFESFSLTDHLSALKPGTNVLAIHGLNLAAANPDFLQLAELETKDVGDYAPAPSYLSIPTPGNPNAAGSTTPGPAISLDQFSPALPTTADNLTVTCRVLPVFSPVAAVTMKWRVAYTAEQTLAMNDDGTGGDAVAGDSIYTAVIPKTSYTQGQMVRWFFQATDAEANATRWPVFNIPDNSPQYVGTMIATTGFSTTLPVWYWFAQNTAAASTRAGTYGAVFFNGKLYDNVFIRQRGGFTSTGSRKFDFNTGHHCFISDTVGRVEEANLNGTSLGGAETIIRPSVAFELLRRSGHPACAAFPVLMRVNGTADSAGGRGGVAYFVEQVDERMLERNGLDPDGALYKLDQRSNLEPVFNDSFDGVQKRSRLDEDNRDYQALVDAVHSSNPDDWTSANPGAAPVFPAGFTAQRRVKLFDMLNMANVCNYLAARVIIADTDDTRKNFYMYRDTEGTGEWHVISWDKDGTLGLSLDAAPYVGHPFQGDWARRKINGSHQWNYLWEACFNDAKIRPMMLRRLRTLMDTVLGSAAGSPEALADTFWNPIKATTPALGTYNSVTNATIKSFFTSRRSGSASAVPAGLFTAFSAANSLGAGIRIPDAQPADASINFGDIDALPSSGRQEEEFVQLRNPNSFDVDISGWELRRGIEHAFEPGTVIRANDSMYVAGRTSAFRARTNGPRGGQELFVQGSFNGTISARGEIIELWDTRDPANPADDRLVQSITTTPQPTPLQLSLRITELMYDPAPGGSFPAGEYEYIELRNTGSSPIQLRNASFTEGVTFTFPDLTLEPGARTIIAKNAAAFAERYGQATPLAGTFTGSLDNNGERIRLTDAVGEEILDFRYEGSWFPSTHGPTLQGGGRSLVVIDDSAAWTAWENQTHWRSSATPGGSPGSTDPAPAAATDLAWNPTTGITASGEPGRTYRLQRSTSLSSWTDAGWFTADRNGLITATDPAPPASSAFYRLVTH